MPSLPFNPETDTLDAFHAGKFYLVQPKAGGHRSGMDAMMLAACVPPDFRGNVADLGGGAGAAALAVASRCSQTRVTIVENCPHMLGYAQKTLSLQQNCHLSSRLSIVAADVYWPGKQRQKAGLYENSFDFVVCNPPFNGKNYQASAKPVRAHAHHMPEDFFNQWVKTACALLHAKGYFAIIARPSSLEPVLNACKKRFQRIRILPLCSYKNQAASRLLLTAQKGRRTPLEIYPPLILHQNKQNKWTKRAAQLANGETHFFELM